MSAEGERAATDDAEDERNRRSNRRVLVIVGAMTLAAIGWDLYNQLGGR